MDQTPDRTRLAAAIYDAAHLTGTFTLRSGVVSHEYFDKYMFESDPALLREVAAACLALVPAGIDALADVAMTIVLLTCPRMPGSRIVNVAATPMRAYLARTFSARYKGRALDEQLDFVGRMKALDGNMTAEEAVACERLAARARKRASG